MLPLQITSHDIPLTEAIESHIRKRTDKLSQFYDRINSCRVVVEIPQKHKHQGKLFNVRIDLTVPGKELAVNRKSNPDIYVAIRDAFDALERQLEEHARKRHGQVKSHDEVMYGRIARIMSQDGYGFIEGIDDNEYYFSITNVSHPTFEQLMIGEEVEFTSHTESDGLQAHRVKRRSLPE